MSDLPSRKDAQRWLDSDTMVKVSDIVWPLIRGWASGRLVDREAIDYEAAFRCIGDDTPGLVLDDIKAAFAAAIGDGE